jgi:hypothetical protein
MWIIVLVCLEMGVSVGAISRFESNVPQGEKTFWTHLMELLGDVGHVKLVSVCLEIVLILMLDRCTVYAKTTIGLKIILDKADGTPR